MTPPSSPTAANRDQIRYWNEVVGPAWVVQQERLDRQLAPLGHLGLERAAPSTGARVLDVGCGCGSTTMEIADRVGEAGEVTGVDVSRVMLERARERQAAAKRENVCFLEADAQAYAFDVDAFDVVFSRFGVMFFDDPAAAFQNLARALRPAGRLVFLCWQSIERNPWMTLPMQAALRFVPAPPPPPAGAPGPFSLADADRLRELLGGAGFARIEIEGCEDPLVPAGGDPDEATELFLEIGPLAAALREAPVDEATRAAVTGAVRDAFHGVVRDGVFQLPAASWIVQAERA